MSGLRVGFCLTRTKHAARPQDTVIQWLAHEIAAYLKHGSGGVIIDSVATCVVFMIAALNVHPGIEVIFIAEGDLIAIVALVEEHALSSKVVA